MIVWAATAPPAVEGAAYDPQADRWRMLAPAPMAEQQPTRAVWADTAMIVVSEESTFAYRPDDEAWERVGDGSDPSGPAVWTGSEAVTWSEEAAQGFDPDTGTWADLGRPGPGRWMLRVMDGQIYAVGPEGCEGRTIRTWTGDDWREVTEFPAEAMPEQACPRLEQVAALAGRFVVWSDDSRPTFVYDLAEDDWREAAPIPLAGLEQPSGPLLIGDRILVARGAEGAIFDPATSEWTPVDLPGHGREATMVWTGEEVLMWDRCCYQPDDVDAWRWTPPGG